jgi:arginase
MTSWDLIVAPWHLDEHIPAFPVPAGGPELVRPRLQAGSRPSRVMLLQQALADAVARAARPLLLTGDCAAAVGAVAGLQRRPGELAVVWLDGHGDFNTPATTVSGYLGGMPLALLTGRVPELVSDSIRLRPVADPDVLLVDARDLDPAERDALAASQVRRVAADPAAIRPALGAFRGRPVYLHVDVDIVDSSQLPGLRFPAGPGPPLARVADCLAAIRGAAEVTAACIACTWVPEHLAEPAAGDTIRRLAGALGAGIALKKIGHKADRMVTQPEASMGRWWSSSCGRPGPVTRARWQS